MITTVKNKELESLLKHGPKECGKETGCMEWEEMDGDRGPSGIYDIYPFLFILSPHVECNYKRNIGKYFRTIWLGKVNVVNRSRRLL